MAMRKNFTLTHVVYEDDPVGAFFALATLSPLFVAFGLLTAAVVTRRLCWLWALIGAIAVDIGCSVMKDAINDPRPQGSYREGPGMPSEHAAFSTFLAFHFSMWVVFWVSCSVFKKIVAVLCLALWAAAVCVSRHHLGVHTAEQVAAGVTIGFLTGFTSFRMEAVLRPVLVLAQDFVDSTWSSLDIVLVDPYCKPKSW